MKENTNAKAVDSEYSLSAVPESSKSGFFAMLVVMVGFTFFSPSMSAGGQLGIGLNMKDFFIAMILGNTFLGVYTGVLAYIGNKTGLTLDLLARYSFGVKGSYLPSALISFTQIGWFGVGVAMFVIPVARLLNINVIMLLIITGFVMTFTAYYGIKALAALGSIAVPLIAILGTISVNSGISQVGGFSNVFQEVPAVPITFATALSITVGSFVSGGTATPNFTRFAKNKTIAVISTVIAFFLGNSLMFVFGAIGGAVTGNPDIFDILIAQGLMIPAIVVLGLNIWTTNNNALYTAGLGLSNITKKNSKIMVLIGGTIGTISAIWLYNNFVSWLSFLGSIIPPVGAVIIVDFILNQKNYEDSKYTHKQVNINAIIAVAAGASCGILLPGIAPINSLVFAAASYFILTKLGTQSKTSIERKDKENAN
ncbi:MAG: cytosine permease [Proteocatella sp.]